MNDEIKKAIFLSQSSGEQALKSASLTHLAAAFLDFGTVTLPCDQLPFFARGAPRFLPSGLCCRGPHLLATCFPALLQFFGKAFAGKLAVHALTA
jgi:hypothetical protein